MEAKVDWYLPKRTSYSRRSFNNVDWKFSHQISITSQTAAGKTTTVDMLKKELPQYEFLSVGQLMRGLLIDVSKKHGLKTIEEFAAFNLKHPEYGYDHWGDSIVHEITIHKNFLVGEGRLVHVFMPHAFHVLLECGLTMRMRRRFEDKVKKDPDIKEGDVMMSIFNRDEDDTERYKKLYRGCIWEPSDYDMVVSTEFFTPSEVVSRILFEHSRWRNTVVAKRKTFVRADCI